MSTSAHEPRDFADKTILVSGATGLIGSALCAHLSRAGAKVIGISRDVARAQARYPQWRWVNGDGIPEGEYDAVVNLAGASIASGRWTAARKAIIRDSRLHMTHRLLEHLRSGRIAAPLLVNASAVGIYGTRGDAKFAENDVPGGPAKGFGQALCRDWEAAADAFSSAGVRVIKTRFGVVLARRAPAWQQLTASLPAKIATYLGSGRQWFSWVHLDDVVAALCLLLNSPQAAGAVNLTAPEPLTQKSLAERFCEGGYAKVAMPVPGFMMRALYGRELADELLLGGQAVVPEKLKEMGFTHRYPTLMDALPDLLD